MYKSVLVYSWEYVVLAEVHEKLSDHSFFFVFDSIDNVRSGQRRKIIDKHSKSLKVKTNKSWALIGCFFVGYWHPLGRAGASRSFRGDDVVPSVWNHSGAVEITLAR